MGTTNAPTIQPTTNPIMVQLPNGDKIVSTHTTTLPLPDLPSSTGQAHIFPDLIRRSLISVSQLCDHGCDTLFTTDQVVISKNGEPILTGNQCPHGLWTTSLESPALSIHKQTLHTTTHCHPLRLSNFSMHPCSDPQLQRFLM